MNINNQDNEERKKTKQKERKKNENQPVRFKTGEKKNLKIKSKFKIIAIIINVNPVKIFIQKKNQRKLNRNDRKPTHTLYFYHWKQNPTTTIIHSFIHSFRR